MFIVKPSSSLSLSSSSCFISIVAVLVFEISGVSFNFFLLFFFPLVFVDCFGSVIESLAVSSVFESKLLIPEALLLSLLVFESICFVETRSQVPWTFIQ